MCGCVCVVTVLGRITDLVEFSYDKLRVIEGADLLEALSVDDGHSLEAHGLHGGLGGEEEAMVEVVEELLTVGGGRKGEVIQWRGVQASTVP